MQKQKKVSLAKILPPENQNAVPIIKNKLKDLFNMNKIFSLMADPYKLINGDKQYTQAFHAFHKH